MLHLSVISPTLFEKSYYNVSIFLLSMSQTDDMELVPKAMFMQYYYTISFHIISLVQFVFHSFLIDFIVWLFYLCTLIISNPAVQIKRQYLIICIQVSRYSPLALQSILISKAVVIKAKYIATNSRLIAKSSAVMTWCLLQWATTCLIQMSWI